MNKMEAKLKLALQLVCFNSLAYCCDKECPARNKAIEALGLTKDEFYDLKHKFDENLVKLLTEKGGSNESNQTNQTA